MKTAKTKAQLATEMGVSVNTISNWQLKPGFPERGRHGWNVNAVKRWRDENRPVVNAELAAEERRENIELKRTKRQILVGDYVLKSEVSADMARLVATLKHELKLAERELPSRLVGLTVAQVKLEIEAAHRRILTRLSTGEWAAPEQCPNCRGKTS